MHNSLKQNSIEIGKLLKEDVGVLELFIGGAGNILTFVCTQQQQTNWCWAAVTQAINNYKGGGDSQCQIASRTLGIATCCSQPTQCNIAYYLDRALDMYGLLNRVVPGKYAYNLIQNELNNRRLVGVRLGWNGGGGHFITVYQCQITGNTQNIVICDPWYGISTQNYTGFPNTYQGGATWTHTYLTN